MKDDGIAIAVAETLKGSLKNKNIQIIIGETDYQNSFHLLNQKDFIFILDAFYQGLEPGSIHIFKIEEILSKPLVSSMQHDMSIFELMKLYGSRFQGYVIGIEIGEISFGDELSPILKGKFQEICLEIQQIMNRIIEEEISYA